jgi:hypothetical protein
MTSVRGIATPSPTHPQLPTLTRNQPAHVNSNDTHTAASAPPKATPARVKDPFSLASTRADTPHSPQPAARSERRRLRSACMKVTLITLMKARSRPDKETPNDPRTAHALSESP